MIRIMNIVNHAQYVHFEQNLDIFFVWYGDTEIAIFSAFDYQNIGSINFEQLPVIEEVQWSIEDWCLNAKEITSEQTHENYS